MYKRMLIVAAAEGFIIKGLETKLKGIGIESRFSTFKMKDIENKCENTDLVFIFTDDSIGDYAETLVYIKDRCSDNDEQVIVIGTKEEYDTVKGFIPESNIHKLFERPLDMEKLIYEVQIYIDEDAQKSRRKSILIVDDDVAYMSMIMEWLRDKYRVSLANSGMQAITWLAKNHADLILLDYEMPVENGPRVLNNLRQKENIKDVPVMFLTGNSDETIFSELQNLNHQGVLVKTIGKDELMAKISEFFSC